MGISDILVPRPSPESVLEMVKKYKPRYLPAVPTIFVGLLNSPEFRKMDLSFIKGFFSGAAPLAADTLHQLKDLTGATPLEVYGLTETASMATITPWGGTIKPGTVGTPLPSTDVKIVDIDTGKQEMKTGEPGEIIVKGPQVMSGYYKKPEETAEICDLILSLEEGNMADIKLEVDGREVNLNPFVRTFIERTVLGMVTSLSGIDPEPKRISLVIDRKEAAAKPR